MKPDARTAAICGLFCGTCPSYPDDCRGWLSDKLTPYCADCPAGFRECAKEHNVIRCHECAEFSDERGSFCRKLTKFSTQHRQNGICHHAEIIDNLLKMKSHGADKWVADKTAENTCPKCGRLIYWYDKKSHRC